MAGLVLFGADVEAEGHPEDNCEEPAPGTVKKVTDSINSVTVNGNGVADIDSADMVIPSHAHDYSALEGCHEKEKHQIDPSRKLGTVTISSNRVYLSRDDVRDDPITGKPINIIGTNGNTGVTQ